MRRLQQKQILELVQTLKEAAAEIRRLFADNDIPDVISLLAGCQDVALQIGEFIESIKGEGTKTVSLLEEYCETLYRISAEAETIGAGSVKKLDKQLALIENSANTELKPGKIEIAFISHKASMSDSIESIYLAANEDPNCDAFWITVPYYDRMSNGTLGRMHYEGADCYGKNIECTDWRGYDMETRRPDVIFTFAPYDAGNYMTAIHPDYYCERLRNLTDLLVYVPYFVVVDELPGHFCALAGCVYAHKVIVQSEKTRDDYIRLFREEYGEQYGKPEDKFVALGSPKFDKVISTKRSDCTMPDEWLKLIGDRKVILYNTSVASILACDEAYLKKLRSVLGTFKSRGDVALWWRPHPLSETTYESMRPGLAKEYKEIVREYIRGGWGIYDDTPELHRAIAMSDAYYGDRSSLIAMYGITGKPALIQAVPDEQGEPTDYINQLMIEYRKWIIISALCQVGEYCYFTSSFGCQLFRMKLADMIIEYVCSLPGDSETPYFLYGNIAAYNGKLYIAPRRATSIAIYDITDGAIEKVPLPDVDPTYWIDDNAFFYGHKFFDAFAYKDKVFFAPITYPCFIVLDTKTGYLATLDDWAKEYAKLGITRMNSATVSLRRVAISPTVVAYTSQCANVIFFLDLEKETVSVREVGIKGDAFSAACFDGNHIWLASCPCFLDNDRNKGMYYPVGFHIYKYDAQRDVCIELDLSSLNIKLKGNTHDFEYAIYCERFVYICPYENDDFIRIDCLTNEIDLVHGFETEINATQEFVNTTVNFPMAQLVDDCIYAFGYKTKTMYCYDTSTGQVREQKVTFDAESFATMVESEKSATLARNGILLEPRADLAFLCNSLYEDRLAINEAGKMDKCGEGIYECIKNIALVKNGGVL